MPRSLWLQPLGLALLCSTSCSSSLNEFRCETSDDCSGGERAGVCHSSGYCAFLDIDGCDGYRFGKHSGELSDQCVGAAGEADAGVIDARPPGAADARETDADTSIPAPVADIGNAILACDMTALTVSGSASESFGGTTLTEFTWSINSPNGDLVEFLNGPPLSAFRPSVNFVAGTVSEPRINLTPYMDASALYIDTADGHSLIRQAALDLNAGDYSISFSIGAADISDIGKQVEVGFGQSAATPLALIDINLAAEMTTYSANFTVSPDMTDLSITIHSDLGRHYLDHFQLYENNSGSSTAAPIVLNASLETDFSPWFIFTQQESSGTALSAPLPLSLKQYGEYEIVLEVTDSNGATSAPATLLVTHEACTGNGG